MPPSGLAMAWCLRACSLAIFIWLQRSDRK
jgi:hypothetical protein